MIQLVEKRAWLEEHNVDEDKHEILKDNGNWIKVRYYNYVESNKTITLDRLDALCDNVDIDRDYYDHDNE